jgi:hypothetical protein
MVLIKVPLFHESLADSVHMIQVPPAGRARAVLRLFYNGQEADTVPAGIPKNALPLQDEKC